jgi:hypothetical protein
MGSAATMKNAIWDASTTSLRAPSVAVVYSANARRMMDLLSRNRRVAEASVRIRHMLGLDG